MQLGSVKRKQKLTSFNTVSLLTGMALLICCVACENQISGLTSLGLFAVYCIYVLMIRPASLLKYFALYFAIVANIVGCASVEYVPAYLGELKVFSQYIGALPLLVFSRWVFVLIITQFDIRYSGKEIADDPRISVTLRVLVSFAAAAVFVVLLIDAAMIFRNPPAFLLDIDRFTYATRFSQSPIVGKIANVMPYLIFISALATRRERRLLGWMSILLWLTILLWTGTKFGGFMSTFSAILLVHYDRFAALPIRKARRIVFGSVFVLAVLVGAAIVIQAQPGHYAEYFSQRTAQQGQLWWAVYDEAGGELHLADLENEIGGLSAPSDVAENVGSHHGIYGVMYLVAPIATVDAKLTTGSRYTEAGYAAMYYYLGPAGPVAFSAIMAVLIAGVLHVLMLAVKSCDIIRILIFARFFILLRGSLGMFTFNDLLDPLSLCCYGYLAISYLGCRNRRRLDRRAISSYAPSRLRALMDRSGDGPRYRSCLMMAEKRNVKS